MHQELDEWMITEQVQMEPLYFLVMLTIWLPLILYTLKRQLDSLKRRRQMLNIKKLQLEVRRNLKREQLTFDVARSILHASMLESGASRVRQIEQLADLQSLHQEINGQLAELDVALNSYRISE